MEPTTGQLLQNGIQLMMVGMGIVFLFLSLLVGAVSILPGILRRLTGEQAFEQKPVAAPPEAPQQTDVDPDIVTAIQTAIRLYENRQ